MAQQGELCIEEEQDLVFREAAAVAPPGPERDDAPDAAWVEVRVADPVLLFRFSAVTANAHRIHYDHPYATGVEGYPDLVVHGPLTAVLLAELARRRGEREWRSVSYRAPRRTTRTAGSGSPAPRPTTAPTSPRSVPTTPSR